TELFRLSRPIVLAPLASGATSGHLAAAVTAAGGLGLFGGIHPAGPEWIREQIRFIRSRSSGPFGVGFITTQIPRYAENFRVCLEERVPIKRVPGQFLKTNAVAPNLPRLQFPDRSAPPDQDWRQGATNNASEISASDVAAFGPRWLSLGATSWVIPG